METKQALAALSALAHETRLSVFRLLVRQGPDGMAAGEIARMLEVPAPTLSFHLKELETAGLLQARRRHRHVIYAVDFVSTRALLDFLMRDCCQGHPEICCGPLGSAAALEPEEA